ncbi:MAG: glycosyltransferase family 4 protein [archaeon]
MQKKKLLIAADNFLPRIDGIAKVLTELIPRLKEHYDITVLCPDFGKYDDSSITIIRVPISKFLKVGDYTPAKFSPTRVKHAVRGADIVFSNSIGPVGGLAIRYAKILKKPCVAFIHSIEWELVPKAAKRSFLKKYLHLFTKKMARRLYNKCSCIIVPSEGTAETLSWNHITTEMHVVYLGTDVEKFMPPLDKRKAKEALHFNPDDIIIGYHGRIAREKDLFTLLRAFARLQVVYKNIKLLIVGDGVTGIKKALNQRRGVIMAGKQDNVIPYLQAMDIYCLPSLTETTSLSTLEAMSCGLPVVTTPVGFVKDYIRDKFNGLFFPFQNNYVLAKQIQWLIESKHVRQKLGEHARQTVLEKFSWDNTAKGIISVFEEL